MKTISRFCFENEEGNPVKGSGRKMLHRKERVAILVEAFKNVKRKFYMNILVTFIIAVIIAGGYQFATDSKNRQADGEVISTIESVDTDSNNYLFGSDSND